MKIIKSHLINSGKLNVEEGRVIEGCVPFVKSQNSMAYPRE